MGINTELTIQQKIMADKMESALSSVEEGVGRFVYTGDGMNLNLTPLVAAIIAGILLLIPIIINLASLISIPTFSSGGSGYGRNGYSPDYNEDTFYDKEYRGYYEDAEESYGVPTVRKSGKYNKRQRQRHSAQNN